MKTATENNILTIFLAGRIDTNNAAQTESKIFAAVDNANGADIIIDAEKLEYISSAGLRVLMKLRKSIDKPLPVINVSRDVYDIFETTGFTELLDVKRALREISVDGCEFIGAGAYGKVYRIDPETIAKIYRLEVSLAFVERERNVSQKAFLLGVPTAISYDVVKCDDSYGVVYELVDAQTVGNAIKNDRERVSELAGRCAGLLKKLHSIEVPADSELPSRKQNLFDWLNSISEFLTSEENEKIRTFIADIPDRRGFLHGDFHAKNIMLQNNEFVLIDIGDAAYGHPIFDIATQILAYVLFPSNTTRTREQIEGYLGFNADDVGKYWAAFCCTYFGITPEKIGEITQKYLAYGMLLMAFHSVLVTGSDKDALKPRVDAIVRGKLIPAIDTAQPLDF
ncbi:MAG: anti-sigma factor antagonist [Ruminiclostridium sp.]|nr:anti-sigma factor antagonist [Ruminiclostridium sp.]